jgi:hypothetical protein
MKEPALLRILRARATAMGARLFRNNVGMGWVGRVQRVATPHQIIRLMPGDVVIRQARPLHAGLHKGSSDHIGWTPLTITPEMVGQTVAVFTSIESKTGRAQPTAEQRAWIEAVRAAGGIAGVARAEGEMETVIAEHRARILRRG